MFKAKIKNVWAIAIVIFLNLGLLLYAWHEPLIFVSATLINHNWIAFLYWIIFSKNKQNRCIAIMATLFFGLIHYLVFSGQLDNYIFFQLENSYFNVDLGAGSWLLAPWAQNPIISQRALVLYTFGLSLHYFIWLKAIPENRQVRETPNSYSEAYKKLKENAGKLITMFVLGISLLGISLWVFDLSLGARIYFAIATLHAWLELNFLISRFFNRERIVKFGI